ncbi:MAG TPA: hypothetical protein VJA26_09950 [Gammaproteobacteria bacterium]|nr:hypothetical protein [Gammaproteobacteria bacterium]
MGLLVWLEATSFADWVRSSTIGYPMMIASHAIGMAIMVGLALALDMRLLGRFQSIPYAGLHRFLGIAWIGFGINFLSGAALFAAQATSYVTDVIFLSKIGLVLAGSVTAALLQTAVGRDSSRWASAAAPANVRLIAIASMVFWVGAIVTGRLTAYL